MHQTITDLTRHGIVRRSDAIAGGLSARQWKRELELGRLVILRPGVARLVDAPTTDAQRVLSAVWSCGDGALASHRSAAWLWGALDEPGTEIDVTIPRRSALRHRPGVAIHRPSDRGDLTPSVRMGIPCTNPLRALVDLGAVAAGAVAPAFSRLVISGLVDAAAVRAVIDRRRRQGRSGIGSLERALADWPFEHERPDSELEVRFARLLRDAGLPSFELHRRIEGFVVDFTRDESRLIVETDGWEHHGGREAFELDRHRDAALTAAGWRVLRFTWQQIGADPGGVAERVRGALRFTVVERATARRCREAGTSS